MRYYVKQIHIAPIISREGNLIQSFEEYGIESPNSSLADFYDPLTMPPILAKAVDKLYSQTPFTSDTNRVALLFERYQQSTSIKEN